MFGSIKIAMIEYFDERYVALSETVVVVDTATVATAGVGLDHFFQDWDFDNMKLQAFDAVQGPTIAMRWLSEGRVEILRA